MLSAQVSSVQLLWPGVEGGARFLNLNFFRSNEGGQDGVGEEMASREGLGKMLVARKDVLRLRGKQER